MSGIFEPYLALEASAGSGKTFALSVRYLSLLFLGASPQKIVALTFTNKSASEMKQRIFETLKHLETKDELDAICTQIGKTRETVLSERDGVMQKLLQADIKISTLDSFFGAILRHFALHVGLMPDFKTEQNGLENEILKRFLKRCKSDTMYDSLITFSINENKKLGDIFKLLDLLYQKKGEFDITVLKRETYVSEAKIFVILKQMRELFEDLGLGSRGLNTFEADSIEKVMTKGFLQKEDFGYWDYKKFANEGANVLLGELKRELENYFNAKEAYFLGELGKLFNIYDGALLQVSKEYAQLSFNDVTNRLYTLLKHTIAKDFLYFRLDGTIEHLLIDEFQDTSVVQYKILEPIIEEIRSGVGSKNFKTLFFVGDIKQSIYRFRGGAKELFGYVREKLSLHVNALDTNYRSLQNVVEFVNDTFIGKLKQYEPQKVAKPNNDGFVSVILDNETEKSVLSSIERLLSGGVKPKDIALLVHTNKDAGTIKETILEHFPHLHVRLEATLRLVEVNVVKAIIYLLKYLYFKENIYLAHFLTLTSHSWKDEVELRGLYINETPFVLIEKIITKFGLFDNGADLLKFLEVSSRFEDIEAFLFAVDTLSDEAKSEDEEGLRVLTIHKSKGLEFEHVIIVDKFTKDNNKTNTILYEYNDIDISGVYLNMSGREYVDEVYNKAKEKEKRLSLEDKLNAQYVAFTRAKRSLIVCAKEEGSTFESLLLSPFEIGTIIPSACEKEKEAEVISVYKPQKYGSQELLSSQEEVEQIDIKAITFGIALHYMLEMLEEFDKASLDNAYTALKNRYTQILTEMELRDIYARVERLLGCQEFLELTHGAKISKEQPLFYKQERKQIDLLLEFSDKIIVVDYKSSYAEQVKHKEQVAIYQEALSDIFALPVVGYVCYLKNDGIALIKSL